MSCNIVAVGKRRDGGTRYWCLGHHANATAKYGTPAAQCVAADDAPITAEETLHLDFANYPGGVALWGSAPAVYDTSIQPTDRGVHVHARSVKGVYKDIDKTYRRLRIPLRTDLLSDGWAEVDEIDAINYMVSGVFGFETIPVRCTHCGFAHLDRDWFAVHAHRKHQCHGCGRPFSDSVAGVASSRRRAVARSSASPTRARSSRRRTKPNRPIRGRLARLTFSRTGRPSIRPSSLRDSGISASPARIDPTGRPGRSVAAVRSSAAVAGIAP